MRTCNIMRDLRERLIPPTIKFVTIVQHQDSVHFVVPASYEACSGLQARSVGCKFTLPLAQSLDEALNVATCGAREASLPSLLKTIRNSAPQEVGSDVRCHRAIYVTPSRPEFRRLHRQHCIKLLGHVAWYCFALHDAGNEVAR